MTPTKNPKRQNVREVCLLCQKGPVREFVVGVSTEKDGNGKFVEMTVMANSKFGAMCRAEEMVGGGYTEWVYEKPVVDTVTREV